MIAIQVFQINIKRFVYLSVAVIALSITASAQISGKVMARVDIESGGGGASGVIFKLYRVQSGCCDPCKKPPVRACRKCGCLIASALADSVTLKESGSFIKEVPAGTYLVVNEVDGQSAGYEKFIEVKPGGKEDLGKLSVDNGVSLKYRMYHRPKVEP